jgi:hypothetical protein
VPPQPQVRLDPVLHRDQAQLAQPVGLGRAKVAVQELLERLAATTPALRAAATRQPRHPRGQQAPRRGGQLLKPGRIQGLRRHSQQVARLAGDQHLAGGAACPVGLQRPAQAHHVRLQGLGGGRRRVLSPQPADQRLRRHHLVGSCQQQGQQQPFLLPAQLNRAAVGLHFQRPEDLEAHGASVVHHAPADQAKRP